jgi:hypothetical protein
MDLFKEYSKRAYIADIKDRAPKYKDLETTCKPVMGIERIDDLEDVYNDFRKVNEGAVINSSSFIDEIDEMIEKEIAERVAEYEARLHKGIIRNKRKGIDTSYAEDNLSKDVEAKERELIITTEIPEFREHFVERKANTLVNKYLWKIFEKEYLQDGYYSLRKNLVSGMSTDSLEILTLILRGEYKQVFIMGYEVAPEAVKQALKVMESLHRISIVRAL